ncbi:MAG: hypothetical protein D8M57_01025 [Candidatus Scalindua sp. AMX11]|nr:MAG: hypothetical protein DWQ00_15005 [Candidatus Scalindua sp.]NOG84975.1 hypothetical protein [Planctomycetota bacterium]RZV93030.1 MAG: hypothetical protein EX341_03960 [Candidatus Scalindua sp. SCAELEC01]TDE66651.1 MAG: hypothetical protein D8M57_01025 [Candidatus Scalindua sp. AMX11]GJQ57957.1 MAG: hypothetical protein SCALA701_07580 [Candidatus Scalindua sp.]
MGNGKSTGLSVNAKTIVMILLFLNVGFTVKMINKYNEMKDAGYVREKTFEEYMQKRVMRAFGSIEEMNKIVEDAARQKEEADRIVKSVREHATENKRINNELASAKTKLLAERSKLQSTIAELRKKLKEKEK